MALVREKKDIDARVRSMNRAQAILNAYDWLLHVIPNNTETVVFANRMALRRLMKEWQGAWSEYQDFTELIVPFETLYIAYRKHYKARGIDMSRVPVLIRQDNKMLPVRYVNEADLKKNNSNNPNGGINVGALLGLGAVIAGVVLLFGRKRPLSGGFSGTPDEHTRNVTERTNVAESFIIQATKNPSDAIRNLAAAKIHISIAMNESQWIPSDSLETIRLKRLNALHRTLLSRNI